jgi:hypothetical protein
VRGGRARVLARGGGVRVARADGLEVELRESLVPRARDVRLLLARARHCARSRARRMRCLGRRLARG